MIFAGKTAVVTGGSRGIGRAVVRRLAQDGARVVFSYKDNSAAAREVASGCDNAVAVRADQEDLASIDTLLRPVGDRLDILVTNAAVSSTVRVADITAEEFDRVMTVNVKYPVMLIRRAIPLLPENGRVITISTLNTALPVPGNGLYSASKAALEQISAVAARELGDRGITVNIVSPGATDTEMFRRANTSEAVAQTAALTALGRLGQPTDIANVVAFLAGPDGQWITGQNLRATGGLIL
jgi:3-oxoacyl-[acyl-carrier protein] reductase